MSRIPISAPILRRLATALVVAGVATISLQAKPAFARGGDSGHILVADQFNDRVIEVNMLGKTVFTQGALNLPGSGYDQLNGPYDAKQIGDFTGLTPPFGY